MSTAIIKLPTGSGASTLYTDFWGGAPSWTIVGGADLGGALRTLSDGYTVNVVNPGGGGGIGGQSGAMYFIDESNIPLTATINSVQISVQLTATLVAIGVTGGAFDQQFRIAAPPYDLFTMTTIPISGLASTQFTGSGTFSSAVMTTNPATGLAWTFTDIYGDPNAEGSGNFRGWWTCNFTDDTGSLSGPQLDTVALSINYIALTIDYTEANALCYFNPLTNHFRRTGTNPGPPWVRVNCPNPGNVEFVITPIFGSINGGD